MKFISLAALAGWVLVSAAACSRGGEAGSAAPVAAVASDTVDVFSVQVGDCLSDNEAGDTVSEMKKLSCAQPHDYEVYHTFELPAGAYPGEAVVDQAADAGCTPVFERFIGKAYDDSELSLQSLTPQQGSWKDRNDREVVCMIVSGDETQLTGSARGANR